MAEERDCYGEVGCCKTCSMEKRDEHRTNEPDPKFPGLNKCKCNDWVCGSCIYATGENQCTYSEKNDNLY